MKFRLMLIIIIIFSIFILFKKTNYENFTLNFHKNKIAFIFLTVGNIKQINIWKEFFKDKEDLYNIYIHPKYPYLIDKSFQKYIINKTISTRWGDISLVNATKLLINEALKDNLNKKIILVSDSCIPIKSFDYIYKNVLVDNKSWFNFYKPNFNNGSREHLRRLYLFNEKIRKYIHITDQWMILDRQHALSIIKNKQLDHLFLKPRLIPDEMYFISMLHLINPNIKKQLKFKILNHNEYIKHNKITYAKWYDPELQKLENLHPIEFNKLKKNDLINLKKSKCLFARKFSKKSDIYKYWKYII